LYKFGKHDQDYLVAMVDDGEIFDFQNALAAFLNYYSGDDISVREFFDAYHAEYPDGDRHLTDCEEKCLTLINDGAREADPLCNATGRSVGDVLYMVQHLYQLGFLTRKEWDELERNAIPSEN
jgi:hypothetical protein